jgi:hypothetical protein
VGLIKTKYYIPIVKMLIDVLASYYKLQLKALICS